MSANGVMLEKAAVCPACRQNTTLRYPNPRCYAAEGREADQHVTSYKWAAGIETTVIPHHYAVWQCPHCYFADLRESVEAPKNTAVQRALLETQQGMSFDKKVVLRRLRKLLPPAGEPGLGGAVALHLAALWITLLGKEEQRDHLRLGRLYLRLAWLFREQAGGRMTERKETEEPPTRKALQEALERLESEVNACGEEAAEVQRLARQRAQELHQTDESASPYHTLPAAVHDRIGELRQALAMLQRTLLQDARGDLQAGTAAAAAPGDDLGQNLVLLKPLWPEIPTNETQCLRLAVDSFERSIVHDSGEQSIEQVVNLIGLMVTLLTRLGDFPRALEAIAGIFKMGTNTKWDLQRRLNEAKKSDSLTPYDERMLQKKIATIAQVLEQAKLMQKRIYDAIIDNGQETIQRILAEQAGQPLEAQEKALREAGFADEIIAILKDRGLLREEKKKAWFGRG